MLHKVAQISVSSALYICAHLFIAVPSFFVGFGGGDDLLVRISAVNFAN